MLNKSTHSHHNRTRFIRVEYIHQLRRMHSTFISLSTFLKNIWPLKNQKENVSSNKLEDILFLVSLHVIAVAVVFLLSSLTNFFLLSKRNGGAMRDRTADLLDANQALSQLSYSPIGILLICYHVICVDTRETRRLPLNCFYFKIRR